MANQLFQVLERKREHLVELREDGFSRPMIHINTDERVWFRWKIPKNFNDHVETFSHSVVLRQICSPVLRHDDVTKDIVCESAGPPTGQGLMSYVFDEVRK